MYLGNWLNQFAYNNSVLWDKFIFFRFFVYLCLAELDLYFVQAFCVRQNWVILIFLVTPTRHNHSQVRERIRSRRTFLVDSQDDVGQDTDCVNKEQNESFGTMDLPFFMPPYLQDFLGFEEYFTDTGQNHRGRNSGRAQWTQKTIHRLLADPQISRVDTSKTFGQSNV